MLNLRCHRHIATIIHPLKQETNPFMSQYSDSSEPRALTANTSARQVFSVSELNRKAKQLLEIHLPLLWVEGEISNLSKPSSGHWYFTLKDDGAQVRCAMFRSRNTAIKLSLKAGDKVRVRARVSLYEGRGDYQLIVEHMEDAGFGLLQKRYEDLKKQLEKEGLFEQIRKKQLPPSPLHLAVITSPTGAAIRDVLSVLKRRFASIPISIIPCSVQGDGAAQQLLEAVQLADSLEHIDLILLCRGGGSIEDLWAFNNEKLARVISACETPIVSAIGHEIDFTIADFVADYRAPTPSAAAEIISPNRSDYLRTLQNNERRLHVGIQQSLTAHTRRLRHLQRLLRHPGQQLNSWAQRMDQLEIRLANGLKSSLSHRQQWLAQHSRQLTALTPSKKIVLAKRRTIEIKHRLDNALKHQLEQQKLKLGNAAEKLTLVSPLHTLRRGYAIARKPSGRIVRSTHDTELGDHLAILLSDGELKVEVEKIEST